jgi:hypothetical protein
VRGHLDGGMPGKTGLVRNGVRPGRGRFNEADCFRVRRNPREILGTRQLSFGLPTTGLLAWNNFRLARHPPAIGP